MRLTTVLASVNLNPEYYMFIPKQIVFWNFFNIKFIAVIIGDKIPDELIDYKSNIILWNRNLHLNTAFVAQNLRIYYPSMIDIPSDELVMITDMDMLPMNGEYYKNGLEGYTVDDFIYYRYVPTHVNEIIMCYNAAHPKTWGKVFNINNIDDIENIINNTYDKNYNGVPGDMGWFIDQQILYKHLINYPNLKVLNRDIRRLDICVYKKHLLQNDKNFVDKYDDAHFHRSYFKNENNILDAEKQLTEKYAFH